MHQGIALKTFVTLLPLLFATTFSQSMARSINTQIAQNDATRLGYRPEYRFGVLPFMSPIALFRRFSPLRDYINTNVGAEFILLTSRSMGDHQANIGKRRYDFVLTAPHFVEPALQSGHYTLIATHSRPLQAIVAVHKNGKIRNIRDFQLLTVATPPDLAVVSVIGKKIIIDARKGMPDTVRFRAYASHTAAYHAVLANEVDAAVISINEYRYAIMQHNAPLHAITVSKEFPAVAILAASNLPKTVVQNFRALLIEMHTKPEGQNVLDRINFPGYRLALAEEYKNLHLRLQQSIATQACDILRVQ